MYPQLDKFDKDILKQLQLNARISLKDLSAIIFKSAENIDGRIMRMEDLGVIKGYITNFNLSLFGKDLAFCISVKLRVNSHVNLHTFKEKVMQIPEVINFHLTAGNWDFILHAIASDMEDFQINLLDKISGFENIKLIKVDLVLSEMIGNPVIDLSNICNSLKL